MTVPVSRVIVAAISSFLLGLLIGAAFLQRSPESSPDIHNPEPAGWPAVDTAARLSRPGKEPIELPETVSTTGPTSQGESPDTLTELSQVKERLESVKRRNQQKNEELRDARYEAKKLTTKALILQNELDWIRDGHEREYRDTFPNDDFEDVLGLRRDIVRLYAGRLELTNMETHRLLEPHQRYRSRMREARDSPDRQRIIKEMTRDILHSAQAVLPTKKFEVFKSFYEEGE